MTPETATKKSPFSQRVGRLLKCRAEPIVSGTRDAGGEKLGLGRKLRDWIIAFLDQPIPHYEQHSWMDARALERSMRKGDVLLVEGSQRVSVAIKYLTQSTWSHAALYIGDELLRRDDALRERALAEFGEEADALLVEALMGGVVVSPLSKYFDHNVRLCRPHSLCTEHLRRVLDDAVASVGLDYDLRNALALLFYFLPIEFVRRRFAGTMGRKAGSDVSTEVMCTSLLGQIFQRVGFPVLPVLTFPEKNPVELYSARGWLRRFRRRREPWYQARYKEISPALLAPRDFDLSPYFDIIKFNVIEEGRFDYRRIQWTEPEPPEAPSIDVPS